MLNQLGYSHSVTYPKSGDFVVDDHFTFEVGGKNKTKKQIAQIPDSYIISDQIEIGFENKIPIWLFGLLY